MWFRQWEVRGGGVKRRIEWEEKGKNEEIAKGFSRRRSKI